MVFERQERLEMGRKRKHTDGKYDRVQEPVLVGESVGGGTIHGCIIADEGHDKHGHRYVLVQWFCNPALEVADRSCPVCRGKPRRHRYDKLKAGRIKSCGRLKKKLRFEYLKRRKEHPLIDVNGMLIPPDARLRRGPRL